MGNISIALLGVAINVILLSIFTRSQVIYMTEEQTYQDLNAENKIVALEHVLDIANEKLRELESKVVNLKYSYSDLLKLFGSQVSPNDATIDEICRIHRDLVVPHPTICRLYYNCSGSILSECRYPFLFSKESRECKNYTEVDCGNRTVSTWECQYGAFSCRRHCIPCYILYPSCVGKKDGYWPNIEGSTTPYYIECLNERRIATQQCQKDSLWDSASYFYNGTCRPTYAVPESEGGLLPSCYNTPNGNYRYPEGRCDAYYRCEGGELTRCQMSRHLYI
ncbi:uncharacterized protein LOC134234803 [Saccostrea cucullata]|uniref:uncharacterized protein LOC134234803 n=1 Tax=Saccostrea cuccullata TaxID=36930 RepID=UPI002ED4EA4C